MFLSLPFLFISTLLKLSPPALLLLSHYFPHLISSPSPVFFPPLLSSRLLTLPCFHPSSPLRSSISLCHVLKSDTHLIVWKLRQLLIILHHRTDVHLFYGLLCLLSLRPLLSIPHPLPLLPPTSGIIQGERE